MGRSVRDAQIRRGKCPREEGRGGVSYSRLTVLVGKYAGDELMAALSETVDERAVLLDASARHYVQQATVAVDVRLGRLHVAALSTRDAPCNSQQLGN